MSITINDHIENMIARKMTIEQCYNEISYWPEGAKEDGLEILKKRMQDGAFDVPLKYHHTVILPPADPIQFISKVPEKKIPWYKKIFKK